MAIVIDLIRKKNEHHVFNYETIKAIDSLEKNSVYHIDEYSSAIDAAKNGYVVKYNVKSNKVYLWLLSSILMLKILFSARKSEEKILVLSATPLQYKLCTVFSKVFNVNIVLFMHGELGYINSPFGMGQKLGKHLLLSAFCSRSNVTFVAINEYIYKVLSPEFKNSRFSFVEHPLQKIEPSTRVVHNGKLIIGSFGVHSKEKNSEKIYELAELLFTDSVALNVQLVTVGVTNESFDYDKHQHVSHLCRGSLSSSLIPKSEFIEQVRTLDFALFFNGMDRNYELIPSGVFADCIALELPIIAINNEKMQYFFDKYGEIGVLCEDVKDMAGVIERLSKCSDETARYKNAIRDIKSHFTFEAYQLNISRILYG